MRHWRIFITAMISCALAGAAEAAPRLDWVFPAGGKRGSTFRAKVAGGSMSGLTGLVSATPGVSAKILSENSSSSQREVEITVAPDAALGRHEIRVYDETGASNPKFFWVGQFREMSEEEPNNERREAQKIEMPVTINGKISRGSDIDSFTFQAKKGQTVAIEFHSLRLLGNLNNSWLKGYARVEDKKGRILAENDGYYNWDPYIEFPVPEDGEYTVSYRDIQYRGNERGVYRLTIGVRPHIWSAFPFGGQRGTTVSVRLRGANLGTNTRRDVQIPADALEDPRVRRRRNSSFPELTPQRFKVDGIFTNYQRFVASRRPNFLEQEPNDDVQSANRVKLPVEVYGILEKPGDVDSYIFAAKKGQRLEMEILSRRAEKPTDSVIVLLKADGSKIAENDDALGRDSRLTRTIDADGDYIIQVRDIDERGGPAFVYRLSLAPPRPDFGLVATQDKPTVKPGGSVTLNLDITRANGFDGPITVKAVGLPPGLTAAALVIPKGQNKATLTLNCAPGTPHQAIVLRLVAEATIAGQTERREAVTTETYNIQGTAFQRDLKGPVLVVTP